MSGADASSEAERLPPEVLDVFRRAREIDPDCNLQEIERYVKEIAEMAAALADASADEAFVMGPPIQLRADGGMQ